MSGNSSCLDLVAILCPNDCFEIPVYFTGSNILLIFNPLCRICCGSIFVPNLILFSFVVGYGDACIIMMLKQKKMEFKPWTNYWTTTFIFNVLDMYDFFQIASNSSLGDNLRIKALHFVSWLARIKPKVGLDFSCLLIDDMF